NGFGDSIKHGQAEMGAAALARAHAAHNLGAVGYSLLGVKRALIARHALGNDFRVLIDENRHQASPFTALTTFSAASSRLSAVMMGNPDSFKIFFPISTLVPSRRTTRGTARSTSFAAAITPSAM